MQYERQDMPNDNNETFLMFFAPYDANIKYAKMEKILTYIINLEEAKDRRVYMEHLLAKANDILSISFISAVDGRIKSQEEILGLFNVPLSYKRYGRELSGGEIGCTLSHYMCYQKLVASRTQYALILEDDITLIRDIREVLGLIPYVDCEEPTIIFLSGDYWFYKSCRIDERNQLTSVYDAVGSYAYLINIAAAKKILKKNKMPACVADNWSLYRKQGVRLRAVYPYMVDANIESFSSSINQTCFGEIRKNMPWKRRLDSYKLSLCKRVLLKCGKFVSKIRK